MVIAEKKPVPIYEVTCCECKSKIQYKKSEVFTCHIRCPVCGLSLWADTIQPVRYEEKDETVEVNIYDEVEVHDNCTVQILKNTETGEISVGWWENEQ